MARTYVVACTARPCVVYGLGDNVESSIWFKTEPLTSQFCHRAIQVQLKTHSCDQGFVIDDTTADSFSWFELYVAVPGSSKEDLIVKSDYYRSHCNNLASSEPSIQYGKVFDRSQGLLSNIQVGDVIVVRVCAQFQGWENYATSGELRVKELDEDIFATTPWSLEPSVPETFETAYSVTSDSECSVSSERNAKSFSTWFSTPPLTKTIVDKLQQLQFDTHAYRVNPTCQDDDSIKARAWFEIVVLGSADPTRTPVWRSHDTPAQDSSSLIGTSQVFKREIDELFSTLKEGDIIAIRVCAQGGCKHYAYYGRLSLHLTAPDDELLCAVDTPIFSSNVVRNKRNQKVETFLENFLRVISVSDEDSAESQSINRVPRKYSFPKISLLDSALVNDSHSLSDGRPLRLLSLDGGGVRGIAALHILQAVQAEMLRLTGGDEIKPCDYFDMIAGTSTGGLIAIMLGRLRMSVQDCIEEYNGLAKEIFSDSPIEQLINNEGARFSGQKLEAAIKRVVREQLGREDESMLDSQDGCKVFVLSVRAKNINNMLPTCLRTYTNHADKFKMPNCSIWEAARATSAAPTYFPSITINDWKYVDGGLGFNNPVMMVIFEAMAMFGGDRPISCLLSIGTGLPPNISVEGNGTNPIARVHSAFKALWATSQLAMNSEHAHGFAEKLLPKGTYYRFNAVEKIPERRRLKGTGVFGCRKETEIVEPANNADRIIKLDKWNKMDEYVQFTCHYLKSEGEQLEQCAKRLLAMEAIVYASYENPYVDDQFARKVAKAIFAELRLLIIKALTGFHIPSTTIRHR